MPQEVTDEQREIIVDLAGLARPWSEIIEASGLSLHVCERVLKEADLWPKPTLDWQEVHVEEEDPPWFPPPGSKEYPDGFLLKPEDRARLEEVRKERRRFEEENRKVDGTARIKKQGSHAIDWR